MFKAILITFTVTASIFMLSAHLFLNSILGMLALAAIPMAILSKLQVSQKIVDTMRAQHLRKQTRITKRFIKRSGRRVASTALSAATVGTVAVAVIMTTTEISDHCDQKRTLQEEANILYGTNIEFDFEKCLEESTDDAEAILTEAKATATSRISDAFCISRAKKT